MALANFTSFASTLKAVVQNAGIQSECVSVCVVFSSKASSENVGGSVLAELSGHSKHVSMSNTQTHTNTVNPTYRKFKA